MIVYKFGAREPVQNAERVNEQIVLAHRYRNLLTEIERARRGAERAEVDQDSDVASALGAVSDARAALPPCPTPRECEEKCTTCRALKPLYRRVSAARWAVWKAVKAARLALAADAQAQVVPFVARLVVVLPEISERAKALGKIARAQNGLSGKAGAWGSYLVVEQAADAARKTGVEPHFRRYDGTGRIAVQLQGGLSVADALDGSDTRLRIAPEPDGPGSARTGGKQEGSRRAGKRYSVQMRVGSEGRAPIWAVISVTAHRPLPEDGQIKWAILRRDRIGPDFVWSFQMTVDEGSTPRTDPKTDADRKGTVALDLGWRMRPDGMRVGYWQDDAGKHGEIVLPEHSLEDLDHVRALGSLRDRMFNSFRDRLAEWATARMGVLPEWFRRETEALPQWRSADRLARFAWRWHGARFDGDGEIFLPTDACPRDRNGVLECDAHVACWYHRDRHLDRWQANRGEKVRGRRDETYRTVAAVLARHYRVVVIEKFHLPDVHGRAGLGPKATDGEKVRADNVSSRRHAAAPGTFRQAVVNACRARGTLIAEIAAEYTTQDCADCGTRNNFDAAPAIDHRCTACGATWDQDRNAARNLLRRYAASGPVTPPDGRPLAGRKSARQERFSKRRGRAGAEAAGPRQGCSQEAPDVPDMMAAIPGAVATLAQERRT